MIKGLLFDLDGGFYVSNRILDGANSTIEWVNKNKLFYKFITNLKNIQFDKKLLISIYAGNV